MNINEAIKILKENDYIVEDEQHDKALAIANMFNIPDDVFTAGKIEKAINKMVDIFAKKYNMTTDQVYSSGQIRNIQKGLSILGRDRIFSAVNSSRMNAYDVLFDEMISALQTKQTKPVDTPEETITEPVERSREEIIKDPDFKTYWGEIYQQGTNLGLITKQNMRRTLNLAIDCFNKGYPVKSCISRIG